MLESFFEVMVQNFEGLQFWNKQKHKYFKIKLPFHRAELPFPILATPPSSTFSQSWFGPPLREGSQRWRIIMNKLDHLEVHQYTVHHTTVSQRSDGGTGARLFEYFL